MVTVADIREQLRWHAERIDGEPWPDETLDQLWMWVALLAHL